MSKEDKLRTKMKTKTKVGSFFCKVGFHWWKYDCYRTCRRCGKKQMLVESLSSWWEDCYQPHLNQNKDEKRNNNK